MWVRGYERGLSPVFLTGELSASRPLRATVRQREMPDIEEEIMFRCPICNRLSEPKERPVKLVTETRPKEYYEEIRGRMHLVGVGREIVREVMMCRGCGEKERGE